MNIINKKANFTVTVFISGRGSNLKALIDKATHYSVTKVITDNPVSSGLEYAKDSKIDFTIVDRKTFATKELFFTELLSVAKEANTDLYALAGFMRILPPSFVNEFKDKLINIHPSLLPLLPGLDTHKRALNEKIAEHGTTVHKVDAGVDTGAIIAQMRLKVADSDTESSLANRVLKLEHVLYPFVVNMIASNNIRLKDINKIIFTDLCCKVAQEKNINLKILI